MHVHPTPFCHNSITLVCAMSEPLELVESPEPLELPESFVAYEVLVAQLEAMPKKRTFEGRGVTLAEATEIVRACNALVATHPRMENQRVNTPPVQLRLEAAKFAYSTLKHIPCMEPEYLRGVLTPDVLHVLMGALYAVPRFVAGTKRRLVCAESVDMLVNMLEHPGFQDANCQAHLIILLTWFLVPNGYDHESRPATVDDFARHFSNKNYLTMLRGFVAAFRYLDTEFAGKGVPPPSEYVGVTDLRNPLVFYPLVDAFDVLSRLLGVNRSMAQDEAETYTDAVCAAISSNTLTEAVRYYLHPLISSAQRGRAWPECIQRTVCALAPRVYDNIITEPSLSHLDYLLVFAENYKRHIGQAPWLLDVLIKATKITNVPGAVKRRVLVGLSDSVYELGFPTQQQCAAMATFMLYKHDNGTPVVKYAKWVPLAMKCFDLQLASPRDSAVYMEEVLQYACLAAESDKICVGRWWSQPFVTVFSTKAISLACTFAQAREEDRPCSPETAGIALVSAIKLCLVWNKWGTSQEHDSFLRATAPNALRALFTGKDDAWDTAFNGSLVSATPVFDASAPVGEPLVAQHHLRPLANVVMTTLTEFSRDITQYDQFAVGHVAAALAWVPVLAGFSFDKVIELVHLLRSKFYDHQRDGVVPGRGFVACGDTLERSWTVLASVGPPSLDQVD